MAVTKVNTTKYLTVTATTTTTLKMAASGDVGDFIAAVVCIPSSTSPGAVVLLDGTTSITLFAGGASSLSNLQPFTIFLEMTSKNGPFKLNCGASITGIAIGRFS